MYRSDACETVAYFQSWYSSCSRLRKLSGEVRIPRKDFRAEPVRNLVVIGESNAFGMSATDPRNEWVQTVANLIRDFQEGPLRVLNNAVPANVVSRASSGYSPDWKGSLPPALDRYEEDLISHKPDLAIIAYGLNDSRCGNPVEDFIRDYEQIVRDVRERTSASVVLVGPYWNTQYDPVLWFGLDKRPNFGKFDKAGRDLVVAYIEAIRNVAERHECLFVDLFTPFESSIWLLTTDQCHYSDVGQRVLGNAVFQTIAANCSFVGAKSRAIELEGAFTVHNTGGTQGLSRMHKLWHGR